MKVLAVILLVACIYDCLKSIYTIEKYRINNGIPMFNMGYLRIFKGAGYQVVMNIIAAVFFALYLAS